MRSEQKIVIDSDALGQEATVATLTHAVRAFLPPGCVALYGPWGSGKTSILHTVYTRWTGPKAWFDPWQYAQRGDVLTPMLLKITRDLGLRDGEKGQRAKALVLGAVKTMLSIASRGALGFLFGGGVDADLSIKSLAGMKPEEFSKHFDAVAAVTDEVESLKATFKALIDEALEGETTEDRVLICLDDLDRCLPDDVVILIEAVKLLLTGDADCRAVFVFALDRRVVGEAIRQRYAGATRYTGENYLEKIFDLSLEVPPVLPGAALQGFCTDLIGDTPEGRAFGRADELAWVLSRPCFANPRIIRRVLHRLGLLLHDEQARAALQHHLSGPTQAGTRRQFLAWLAGVERYRAFRHFFHAAADEELAAVHRIMRQGANLGDARVQRANPFLDAPGFAEFYGLVNVHPSGVSANLTNQRRGLTWTRLEELAEGGPGRLETLADFDRLMRLVGL